MTRSLQGSLSVPQLLSIAEWSLFSLYWRAASKNASPAKHIETRQSRRVHEILVNLALFLIALPIRQLSPRFLPDLVWIAWTGLIIQTAVGVFAIWARRHLAENWSGEISYFISILSPVLRKRYDPKQSC